MKGLPVNIAVSVCVLVLSCVQSQTIANELGTYDNWSVSADQELRICGFSENLHVDLFGGSGRNIRTTGPGDPNVIALVDELSEQMGLLDRVLVRKGSVEVAITFLKDKTHYIVYNPAKITTENARSRDPVVVGIFAHELAHVARNHWYMGGVSRLRREEQADFLTGQALQRWGIEEELATRAYSLYADIKESDRYGSRASRESLVASGWQSSCLGSSACGGVSQLSAEQKRYAPGSVIVTPFHAYPDSIQLEQQMMLSRVGAIIEDQARLFISTLAGEFTSLREIGFISARLGAGVKASLPESVIDKAEELSSIAIILGQAQLDHESAVFRSKGAFFTTGDRSMGLFENYPVEFEIPIKDMAPFLIGDEFLVDEWGKLAVIAHAGKLISEKPLTQQNRDTAIALLSRLLGKLGGDERKLVEMANRFLKVAERN